MWLPPPRPPLAVQGPKVVDATTLKLPATVRMPQLTATARRDLLTRTIPGVTVTTDLSETLVLDFRSEPPKGSWLAASRPVAFVPMDGGKAVFERRSPYDSERGELAVQFPVKKGSGYAVVVVGASGCGSVVGQVKIGKSAKADLAAPIPSGSASFAVAFTAGDKGTAMLSLWPKPLDPQPSGESVVMTAPKLNDHLVVQRVEITRIH